MLPHVLTGKEVARLLRVSRDTVYRLAARGELPGRKIGRIWRFQRRSIEEYLSQQGQGSSPRPSPLSTRDPPGTRTSPPDHPIPVPSPHGS